MRRELQARFERSLDETRERLVHLRRVLRIKPRKDPVKWIEKNCYLPKHGSSEGGSKIMLYGYQRSFVRLCLDTEAWEVGAMKAVRTGITQGMDAVLKFHVFYEGSTVGVWQPTEDKAKEYDSSVWTPGVKESKSLRSFVRRVRKGDQPDRWNEKLYSNGARVFLRFAYSDDQFRGSTMRITAGDEVDAEGWMSGRKGSQGGKFKLMNDRSNTIWDRRFYVWSSPLNKATSNIYKFWADSDKRHYFVHCPHCAEKWHFKWGGKDKDHGVKWSVNEDGHVTDAWYVCEANGCIITEADKHSMIEEAGDAPIESGLGFQPTVKPRVAGRICCHIPGYISLFPGSKWKVLAQEWLDAQGRPEDLQAFVNSKLGEPWEDTQERTISVGGMADRVEPYDAEIPLWAVVITIGIDTQRGSDDQAKDGAKPSRHEVSVWAWGPGEEGALIGHYILDEHEPFSPEAQEQLKHIINRRWRKHDGSTIKAGATFLDMGWMTNEALAFARQGDMWRANVRPVKGDRSLEDRRSPTVNPKAPSITRTTKFTKEGKSKDNLPFIRIGTHVTKNAIDRRLKVGVIGPGYMHFPTSIVDEYGEEYFDDLLAEGVKKDKRGREEWVSRGARTGEAWDCLVYAYAALQWVRQTYRAVEQRLHASLSDAATRIPYDGPDQSAMSDRSREMGIVGGSDPVSRRPVIHSDITDLTPQPAEVNSGRVRNPAPTPVPKPSRRFSRGDFTPIGGV